MSNLNLAIDAILSAMIVVGSVVFVIKALPVVSGERMRSKEFDALIAEGETLICEIDAYHIDDMVIQHRFRFWKDGIDRILAKVADNPKAACSEITINDLRPCIHELRKINEQLKKSVT